jgi:hypothetical protein
MDSNSQRGEKSSSGEFRRVQRGRRGEERGEEGLIGRVH